MDENLESKTSNFFVPNLRNSRLLRAIRALNLNILNLNLISPRLNQKLQDKIRVNAL